MWLILIQLQNVVINKNKTRVKHTYTVLNKYYGNKVTILYVFSTDDSNLVSKMHILYYINKFSIILGFINIYICNSINAICLISKIQK